MNHDLEVSASIEIDADRTKVWHGLTTPEIIRQYLFGTHTETTWQPGSTIAFTGTWEEQTYRDHGVIVEFIPFEKISYTYWSGFTGLDDKPENYSLVTYLLSGDDPSKTTFTWIQKGFATEEGYEHSKGGMDAFIREIKAVIERS